MLELPGSPPGVGRLRLRILSAFKTGVQDAAEGNHYLLVCLEGSKKMEDYRTETVMNSATPIFDAKLDIRTPHYRTLVHLYLVDADTHRRIGHTRLSPFMLLQREADRSNIDGVASFPDKRDKRHAHTCSTNDNGALNIHTATAKLLHRRWLADCTTAFTFTTTAT